MLLYLALLGFGWRIGRCCVPASHAALGWLLPAGLLTTALFLVFEGGSWQARTMVDEDSNVFHKVMEYSPAAGDRGILTLGGTAALVRLWTKGAEPRTLWEADFGGKFSRMRDGEVADVYGSGTPDVVVATHDHFAA